jgi:hypothetical protein
MNSDYESIGGTTITTTTTNSTTNNTTTIIILALLILLFLIIYLSIYYSKSLATKYEIMRDSLAKWFFSLYTSKDGSTLITKTKL